MNFLLLTYFKQGYWKNCPSQQLFEVFIYIYFATTCFGPRWTSSGGIHNIHRDVTSLTTDPWDNFPEKYCVFRLKMASEGQNM
jgi:hypothetical protein